MQEVEMVEMEGKAAMAHMEKEGKMVQMLE